MLKTNLSIKWLEVFQQVSKLGSVSAVSAETGLSVSTVSHHLRSLENHLGVDLLQHHRRPMALTPAGAAFLKHVEEALATIHRAEQEVVLGNMSDARSLRIGMIEDFDSEIAPELVVRLAAGMPNCDFVHYTRSSHEVLSLLRAGEIDVGVVSSPTEDVLDLQEYSILRDPFVLAVPVRCELTAEQLLLNASGLPFLRYIRTQYISRQIEAQLRRLKYTLPRRFEIESNQAMMAMIAEGHGWAVSTPLCFMRSARFHDRVKLLPFPKKGTFARQVSMFTSPECADRVPEIVSETFCELIAQRAVQPMIESAPWLQGEFQLVNEFRASDRGSDA